MDWKKITYVIRGGLERFNQKRLCPSCGYAISDVVDSKGFHLLLCCKQCLLLYRWPYESPEEMARFYQRDYQQGGLTTDLPSYDELNKLLSTSFVGTEKDFARVIDIFEALKIPRGARVLDYGANWGYGVWQFNKAGYDAIGYEISEPRADYSKNLDVEVISKWGEVVSKGPFDVVFSSHVLEHTPDPSAALQDKMSVVSPNGFVVAFFPNGSDKFRKEDPEGFHKLWGKVHPVMLNENFIHKVFSGYPIAVGSYCQQDLERLQKWDLSQCWEGNIDKSEMMAVIRCRKGQY